MTYPPIPNLEKMRSVGAPVDEMVAEYCLSQNISRPDAITELLGELGVEVVTAQDPFSGWAFAVMFEETCWDSQQVDLWEAYQHGERCAYRADTECCFAVPDPVEYARNYLTEIDLDFIVRKEQVMAATEEVAKFAMLVSLIDPYADIWLDEFDEELVYPCPIDRSEKIMRYAWHDFVAEHVEEMYATALMDEQQKADMQRDEEDWYRTQEWLRTHY